MHWPRNPFLNDRERYRTGTVDPLVNRSREHCARGMLDEREGISLGKGIDPVVVVVPAKRRTLRNF